MSILELLRIRFAVVVVRDVAVVVVKSVFLVRLNGNDRRRCFGVLGVGRCDRVRGGLGVALVTAHCDLIAELKNHLHFDLTKNLMIFRNVRTAEINLGEQKERKDTKTDTRTELQ